jgi:hypothetical protein
VTARVALLIVAAAGAACDACSPSPPAPVSPDQVVYQELVDGGCMPAIDGGVVYVAQAHLLAGQPAWMACLYDGGTLQSCAVPCRQ